MATVSERREVAPLYLSYGHQKRREAPAFMPGRDRRWARWAQCPRAQQDPRSTRALNGRGNCREGSPGIHAGEDVPINPLLLYLGMALSIGGIALRPSGSSTPYVNAPRQKEHSMNIFIGNLAWLLLDSRVVD